MTRLRPFVVGVVVACALSAVPLLAQGPFAAQIEQFWQLISTGGRAFTNLAVAAGGYATFGPTLGSTGYGIRDSAGTLQFSNAGGTWAPFANGASLGTCPSAYNIACSLETWTTPASNVGTTLTVLATYTLPANTLSANGQSLVVDATVVGAANSNTKQARVTFGSTFGTYDATWTNSSVGWIFHLVFTRITSGTVAVAGHMFVGANNSAPYIYNSLGTFSVDLTAAVTIDVLGTGLATDDLTFETGKVQWLPAGGLN